jgi:hypothetical protein
MPSRDPAAAGALVAKTLLGAVLGEGRPMYERGIQDLLLHAGATSVSQEAHLMARHIRYGIASVTRADLEADAALKAILLKDVGQLDAQDLKVLHSWAERRMSRLVGSADTDRSAKIARETKSLLQRELLPLSENKMNLRFAVLDFIDFAPPKFLDGSADPEAVLSAIRAARLSELPEEQAIGVLRTMDAMLSYHGPQWDGARAASKLRAMPSEMLAQVRTSYREALTTGDAEPNLVALAGKLAPTPQLDGELKFVAKRDELLRLIDRFRWITSNPVRATEQAQQRMISQIDYLIRIGDKKAARAMVHRQFLQVETSTLYVRKFRSMVAEAVATKGSSAEIRRLEQLVSQQERILGGSFEEYRALRSHLLDLSSGRGTCDSSCIKMASEIEESVGMTAVNRQAFVVSFEGMSRPTLQEVTDTFFSSLPAQEAALRGAVFQEMRNTLMTLSSSVLMLKEFQRIAAKVPALHSKLKWTRGVLSFLYDSRARTIHFPQLSRILRAQGGVREQIQMLEQMALPPNEDLLVTFARRMDQDYRDAWKALKQEAKGRFDSGNDGAEQGSSLFGRMMAAEKDAADLGGISSHFDHSPAVKLGALVVAGYGGYAWHQHGKESEKQVKELEGELEVLGTELCQMQQGQDCSGP